MEPAKQRALCELLTGLRREGRQQSGLDPSLVPPDADTAYRVAAMVEAELGWDVAGWKIAATNAEMQAALRTPCPIYGRVFANHVTSTPYSVNHAPLCSPIPEVEYQVQLGKDLPPRKRPYSGADLDNAVQALRPGIELAECRFVHDGAFPPLPAILADGAGSGTLIAGPEIRNWRNQDISGQAVVLRCNGTVRRSGSACIAVDHPLVPLTWLVNELSRTGIGLKAGQVISTGTLTGMLRPRPGEIYDADFGPFGNVNLAFT